MPPNKGGNAKKEGGRAKKAENEEKKAAAASKAKEAKEADEWKAGAKGVGKGDVEAAKKAEAAAKKAERAALLAAEEAALPTKKAAPKAGAKKAAKPAGSASGSQAALAALGAQGAGLAAFRVEDPLGLRKGDGQETVELGAVGVDQMLEALEIVHEKTDTDALGAKAGLIEKHPERRYKAAFEAYLERELPKLKEDHPGLRQNQMRDILHKQFQKAPENPFNQQSVAYNATKDERVDALRQNMKKREEKYRVQDE
ncbi:hypothetical protein Q5752_002260 [Cryptotrichosporon argae]